MRKTKKNINQPSKKIKDEEGEKKVVHNLWNTVGQG